MACMKGFSRVRFACSPGASACLAHAHCMLTGGRLMCAPYAQAEFLLSRLNQVKERIDDVEDLLNLELDQR